MTGLDFQNTEADAIEAKRRLDGMSLRTRISPKILDELSKLIADHDEKARTVIFAGKPVVFADRSEAGIYREMPVVKELETAFQRYQKDPKELSHVKELMLEPSIPEQIKDAYRCGIGELLKEKVKDVEKGKRSGLNSPARMFLSIAICCALNYLFVEQWDGISWLLRIVGGGYYS